MRKMMKWPFLAVLCMICLFWLAPAQAEAAEVVDGHAVAPLTAAMIPKTSTNVRTGPYPVSAFIQGDL